MADNAQKTQILRTLHQFAEKKILSALQITGKALPCSIVKVNGAIVTVKFEITNTPFTLPNVTIPQAMSTWAREPTQVGDKGYVLPADTYMGGISGLGGGVADLKQRANLATLVYHPVSSSAFSVVDPNAYVLSGPNGVVLTTQDGTCSLTLNKQGITVTIPGTGAFTITGNLQVTENVTGSYNDRNITLVDHLHTGVTFGTDDTSSPVNGL